MKPDSYRYAEINGVRIAYQRQGRGEPMLLVHGTTAYSFIWDTLVPDLSPSFDVIAIDLLGGGRSEKPRHADYSIFGQAEIIHSLMPALGLKTFHLVCHGTGCGIAQVMAARYPEQLRDLVFINPFGFEKWPVQPANMMRVPFIWDIAVAMFDLGFFRLVVERGVYYKDRVTDEVMRRFSEPLKTRDGKYGFLQLAKNLNSRRLTDLKKELRRLEMPVLIIRGEADPYLGPQISRSLHEEIQGSTLVQIKTGGHFIQLDEPDRLVSLIKDFISEGSGSRMEKG